MTAGEIMERLHGVRRLRDGWIANCPAHADHNPLLSIDELGDKVFLFCHAGCEIGAICAAIGITERDLFNDKPQHARTKSSPVACTVPATDHRREDGAPHRARHFTGEGGSSANIDKAIDALRKFKIPADLIAEAGVVHASDLEVRELLGVHGRRGQDLSGIVFPYRDPRDGRVRSHRVRLDAPQDGGQKYLGEYGCRHLYFPPNVKHLLNGVTVPVVIVEAEKSALALKALSIRANFPMLPVAIGGCYGWKRKVGKQPLPNGGSAPETGMSPDLETLISWTNRTAILAFDSNAATNPMVRSSRWKLAHELVARGANVLVGVVPDEEGINGPDDLIAIAGDEAMIGILNSARPFAESALIEAKRLVGELETNPELELVSIMDVVADVDDPVQRELLVGRILACRIPGATRKLLDGHINQHRAAAASDREGIADAIKHSARVAAGQTINGAELLKQIAIFIRRFVLLNEHQATVIALWVVHTHLIDAADTTSYLAITSAEKQCGKTRLLEILELIVKNPWKTGSTSAAALVRKTDSDKPTLLFDESDATFKGDEKRAEALRGILNTGYRRGGCATVCVGEGGDITVRDFNTFGPKAIAGIGRLPDTVQDRSIPIIVKRKAPGEVPERYRIRKMTAESDALRPQIEGWAEAIRDGLQDANPSLPEELTDRQQDGAEPLLAIADVAGEGWPESARTALVKILTDGQSADDSIGVRLLSDIRQIFDSRDTDKLTSATLVEDLAAIETAPWGEWSHGKPISAPKLARLLRPFGIAPHNIRTGDKIPKGYDREDFRDAFTRYLRPLTSPGGPEPSPTGTCEHEVRL